MAGYTRQASSQIINGADITAPPLTSEFNQIETAFGTGGHSHDGTAGNAPKINLATSVSGYLPSSNGGIGGKNNVTATSNPTITDDTGAGYAVGSVWINTSTDRAFICLSNTSSAAVWHEFVAINSANTIVPVATNTVDLGTTSNRFKDLVLSGNATIATNATIGGTLGVTGNTTLSGTLGVTGTLTASGNATVGGTLGVTGDTTVSNLTVSGTNTIASADINSGAMDNTVIGNSTPAAATFTTLNVNTSLVAATADINGGTVDAATIGASTAAAGTFTNLTSTGTSTHASVDINGGTMDGTTIGATSAAAASFTTVSTSGQATLATVDINGGNIDGTIIGASTPAAITGTTVTGTSLVGPVTGNVTGNLTGNVTGNVTGAVTGNVTAGSGTSTFNNVTVNGTLDVTGTTIANVTDPSSAQDAATKNYVDTEVAALVASAPGTLDTLNELAAALNDDPNFSTTITNSIATKLPLSGGTMSGAIAMGTNKITGLGDPTANQDAATKKYTTDTFLPLAGGTLTGAIDMGSAKITTTYTPTDAADLTTKTYVDGIVGSSTAAATSATAAANSATASASSATNSANSATASASSAASSAASLATFQSQYHGAQSSAPTQDPDGSALDLGDLYFDSTTNIMKVYGSGGWANAGSSVNGTSSRQTYTATAGQTVFAITYDSGFVDVYLNGVKLLAGTDFTATNGSNITLASGAAVGDVVDIVAYGTFSLSTHYTKTEADARYLQLSGGTLTGGLTGTTATFSGDLTVDTSTLKVDSSNNRVGVGTTSPIYATDIKTSGTNNGQLRVGGASTSATGLLLEQTNSGNTTANIQNSYYATSASASLSIKSGYTTFHTGTSGTERMRIDSSGNVGIGTSSPSQPLTTLAGTANTAIARFSGSEGARGLVIETASTTRDDDTVVLNANDAFGRIAFETNSTERMRIDGEHVGIGTTAPSAPLDVVTSSNVYAAEFTQSKTSNGDGVLIQVGSTFASDYALTVRADGGNTSCIAAKADGNVGIGTFSPQRHLHINGGNETTKIQITNQTTGSSTDGDGFQLGIATNGTANIEQRENADMVFATNNTERMRINSSGSVGIGTSSVSTGFLVEGTGDARFGDTAGDDAVEIGWSGGGGYAFVQAYDRNASVQRDLLLNGVVKVLATGDVRFSGNSHTPYIQLANSGRVASNPGYSFHNDTNTGMYQPSGAADTVAFSTAGTERMRINSSGHVGINNVGGLSYHLDVYSGGDVAAARFQRNTDSTFRSLLIFKSGGQANSSGYVNITNTAVQYATSSDHRLKENVVYDWDATTRLKQLKPARFNFIADPDTTVDGFLAHEVQTVVPEAASGTHNEVDADGNAVMQGIDQAKLVPLLVKTIKELEARITALEGE